jgi:fumarate hydratase class I
MLTGRDAAHKRIADLFAQNEGLPPGVDFTNRVIYYVGPVDPVRDEVVGPAGPTTATRMDKFTEMMLAKTGLVAMIGKAERGPVAIEAIRKHRAAYLMAVGGAAYLVSKAIRSSRVVAFGDLGMEAIYEFEVQDMPVTVAVDANGTSVHETGPREWRQRIGKIPVTSDEMVPPASGSARVGLRVVAHAAARADGAPDEAQSADHRPHLPHRNRDHRVLRVAAVAR